MESNQKIINGGYPLHTFEDVEDIFRSYIFNEDDRNLISKAYYYALEKHKNQFRKSGEPYIHHLIEVCYICASLNSGPITLTASLLHDVVEDTDTTIEDIEKEFGEETSKIVDALTKIQRLKLSKIESEEFVAEDHRKIFIGMAKDIRVIVIKLADRLHNMRTLNSLSPDRQIALAKETLDVFAPIAHRLGLDVIKSEMEDLCLKYLEPDKFAQIQKLLSKKAKTMSKSLDGLKKRIADILFEKNIPFDISSRVKSIYSIYTKMYLKNHDFDTIYDILALRIITNTELECYEILGLIHKTYTPVPGRFKDYIAMPKPNMYQSLHTTIVSGDGNFYEIQIRTKDMDDIAETGIASHWAYKEGTGYNSKKEQEEIENKLHWFRDFVSISSENENNNASEYMETLTHDIFDSNVYVFTPKGKVIELPNGSTPIDFAYRIHTKIGDTTVGALINGAISPLSTVLKTGDMVEIKTSKTAAPNESWLEFVKTNSAKGAIKKYIASKNAESLREDRIERGKNSCIDAFKERQIDEKQMVEYLSDEKVLTNYECESLEDLFVKVAQRKPTAGSIIDFLKIKKPIIIPENKKVIKNKEGDDCPVSCGGISNIAISLANCCSPVPGDEISGYITRGKGITVHRKDCPNIAEEKERLIDVSWKDNADKELFTVGLLIMARDRKNLVVDLMNSITSFKVNVDSFNARTNNDGTATITVSVQVSNAKKLSDLSSLILGITGVYSVNRIIL